MHHFQTARMMVMHHFQTARMMVMHHHARKRKRRDRLQENLQQMKADGLMSAEGILDHPALFLQRYGTDPERPVTGLRLSDKMRQLTAKLWTLALKEVITSKVDTYNAKLQLSLIHI